MSKTSSKVKDKYNKKVYKPISVRLKKELVEDFEKKLNQDGVSKAEFIRNSIIQYLNN
ncbi:MAG: ribbon-helix-helix domain-containing protein [Ruminococcus sp.]|nr:ribbon-helix-helix domain-containing protein [Ruminococcus sp.]